MSQAETLTAPAGSLPGEGGPSPAAQLNRERLEAGGEIGRFMVPLYDAALAAEPLLADVILRPLADQEIAGGSVLTPYQSQSGQAEVSFDAGNNWQAYGHILEDRPQAVAITAELLGLAPEDMNEKILAGFIFLHELGHVVDWAKNAPTEQALNGRRTRDMNSLPVPGIAPVRLADLISKQRRFYKKYLKAHKGYFAEIGIGNLEEMLEAQETAYRDLETEHLPDRFAAAILLEQRLS